MEQNNGEKSMLRFAIAAKDRLLLYVLTLILGMLSWFSVTMYTKLDTVALGYVRHDQLFVSVGELSAYVRQMDTIRTQVEIIRIEIERIRERLSYFEAYILRKERIIPMPEERGF